MLLPLSHSHSRFKSRSHIHTRRISNFVQKLAPSKEESTGKHAHHDAQTHTRARTLQNRQGDEIVARQRESHKFASHKFVSNSEHTRKRAEHAHIHTHTDADHKHHHIHIHTRVTYTGDTYRLHKNHTYVRLRRSNLDLDPQKFQNC